MARRVSQTVGGAQGPGDAHSARLRLGWRTLPTDRSCLRLIIEARLEGEQASATAARATIVAVVERQDRRRVNQTVGGRIL